MEFPIPASAFDCDSESGFERFLDDIYRNFYVSKPLEKRMDGQTDILIANFALNYTLRGK